MDSVKAVSPFKGSQEACWSKFLRNPSAQRVISASHLSQLPLIFIVGHCVVYTTIFYYLTFEGKYYHQWSWQPAALDIARRISPNRRWSVIINMTIVELLQLQLQLQLGLLYEKPRSCSRLDSSLLLAEHK